MYAGHRNGTNGQLPVQHEIRQTCGHVPETGKYSLYCKLLVGAIQCSITRLF